MRKTLSLAIVAFGLTSLVPIGTRAQAPAATPQAPERKLQLTFNPDGTVTLVAQNVAMRDVLAEWKRKCGCTVVNAEKLTGGPSMVPVQFDRADQRAVLDSLLRQAAGYTLTPQRDGSPSPSQFEVIYILATTQPSSSPYMAGVPTAPPPVVPGSPDDELPPVGPPIMQGQQPQPQAPPMRPPTTPNSPFVPIVPIGGTSPAGNRGTTPGPTSPGPVSPGPMGPGPTGRGGGG